MIEVVDKNVGVSITNDGTYDLAKKLSVANGLIGNINSLYMQDSEALDNFKTKKIDINVTLATKDNQYIQELLSDPDIEVMSLKRVQAYTQTFEYLTSLNLYEGSISLYKNLPSKNISLLSSTQNLVCTKDIPDELIRIFLKKVKQIHSQKSFFQGKEDFLNLNHLDTVVNSEAKLYILHGESWLEKIFPYWIASNIDRLKLLLIPLIWLIIPLFKSIIPLYIFTTRSKIFKWYDRLHDINDKINNKSEDINMIQKEIRALKKEIQLKTKVPLSYIGEYYNLIVHVELLETKIDMSE